MSNPSKNIKTERKGAEKEGGPIESVGVQKVNGVGLVRGNSCENPLEFLKALELNRRHSIEERAQQQAKQQ